MFRFWRFIAIFCLLFTTMPLMAQDVTEADNAPLSLVNYANDNASLILELETLGIIPTGAEELFQQERLFFSGANARFSNFAIENTASNLVTGITLNFAPQSDELEFCGIATRTQINEDNRYEGDNNITTLRLDAYAATGVDNDSSVFAFERNGDENSELIRHELDLENDSPVQLLLVVLDDNMTVFVNGEAIIRDYEVSLLGGAFAFLYAGMDDNSICEATNFFAYAIADEALDICRVSTDRVINRRSGAGTQFALLDQLQAGDSLEAIGQSIGIDGYTWWLLSDNSYVRDDVVDTSGFCRILPLIEDE